MTVVRRPSTTGQLTTDNPSAGAIRGYDAIAAVTDGFMGRDMKTSHQGMGITESDWNAAVNDLVATLDTYLAFANGVNLTIHPEDAGSFQAFFERSVRDFNELYRPHNHASSIAPF